MAATRSASGADALPGAGGHGEPAAKRCRADGVEAGGLPRVLGVLGALGAARVRAAAAAAIDYEDDDILETTAPPPPGPPRHAPQPRARAARAASAQGRWSPSEDAALRAVVRQHGARKWKNIALLVGSRGAPGRPKRTEVQCMHRWTKVLKPGLVKGHWTAEEDAVVLQLVAAAAGAGNIKWSEIAQELPGRVGKQCRERWVNHLDPAIKKGGWTPEEDRLLIGQQRTIGNKWVLIAAMLPGRTENAVKNRWNSSEIQARLRRGAHA